MLVKITGKKNEEILTTTSREVAEHFEKQHKHVLQSIEQIISLLNSAEKSAQSYFIVTAYKDSSGKSNKEYLMTRDGFSLLAMGFTGEKALKWKLQYINAFNEMERELKRLYDERKQWEIERAKGVVVRHILTDTIKMKITESPHKKFMYPNYTRLIYKTIFKKTFKELQTELGVKAKESIRDYLTTEQLRDIESMEMLVSSLINCGWDYSKIKEFLEINCIEKAG